MKKHTATPLKWLELKSKQEIVESSCQTTSLFCTSLSLSLNVLCVFKIQFPALH